MMAKHTNCAAIALLSLAVGAASAADIRAYGVVDMYAAVNNDSGNVTSALQSGGASASLVGLTGEEELRDDLKAVFKLEAGVLMDDGTSAPPGGGASYLFQRESRVGLESKHFGAVSFGRQYSPYFMTYILTDPGAMSMGSAIGNFCWPGTASLLGGPNGPSDNSRRDNSVAWTSPTFGGYSVEVFGAFGEVKGETSTSSTLGNAYSLAAQYRSETLMLRTAVFTEETSSVQNRRKNDWYWVAGGVADLGFIAPSLLLVKRFSRDTAESPDLFAAQLGATTPVGPGKLLASAAYLKNSSASNEDAFSLGLRYDHPLGRRTKVYAGAALVVNESRADYAVIPGPGSSAPFDVEAAGNDAQQIFFGMNHSF